MTTFKYRGYPLTSYVDPHPGRPDGERVMVACPECKGAARGRNCSGGCDHDGRVARAVRTLRNNAKVEAFARDYPGQPDPGKKPREAAPVAPTDAKLVEYIGRLDSTRKLDSLAARQSYDTLLRRTLAVQAEQGHDAAQAGYASLRKFRERRADEGFAAHPDDTRGAPQLTQERINERIGERGGVTWEMRKLGIEAPEDRGEIDPLTNYFTDEELIAFGRDPEAIRAETALRRAAMAPAAPAVPAAKAAAKPRKAGATLTENQRWLLLLMGGWAIIDALCSPAGTKHLMQSSWGGANHTPPEGAPAWLRSFDTRGNKIVAPCGVTVTAAQINRYAAALDESIRAELAACQAARQTNTMQGYEWCHCPNEHTAPNAFTGPCTRYHPTGEDEAAHLAEYRRIREWEKDLLRRALGL